MLGHAVELVVEDSTFGSDLLFVVFELALVVFLEVRRVLVLQVSQTVLAKIEVRFAQPEERIFKREVKLVKDALRFADGTGAFEALLGVLQQVAQALF